MNEIKTYKQAKNMEKANCDLTDTELFVTLADYKKLEQQLQAYKQKEDKLRKYCESNRGYVQGYGFIYREDEKLQEVKNDILEILGE